MVSKQDIADLASKQDIADLKKTVEGNSGLINSVGGDIKDIRAMFAQMKMNFEYMSETVYRSVIEEKFGKNFSKSFKVYSLYDLAHLVTRKIVTEDVARQHFPSVERLCVVMLNELREEYTSRLQDPTLSQERRSVMQGFLDNIQQDEVEYFQGNVKLKQNIYYNVQSLQPFVYLCDSEFGKSNGFDGVEYDHRGSIDFFTSGSRRTCILVCGESKIKSVKVKFQNDEIKVTEPLVSADNRRKARKQLKLRLSLYEKALTYLESEIGSFTFQKRGYLFTHGKYNLEINNDDDIKYIQYELS
eukprot:NODE_1112_length_1051_cov_0.280462.p1 type:complete len:301 gc:universal NODE_1112_length_1051_cov_0.280462:954-52(-)